MYEYALDTMFEMDALRASISGEQSVPLSTVRDAARLVAFWNHLCGKRDQPWGAFDGMDAAAMAALRTQVELGRLPVLEVAHEQVQLGIWHQHHTMCENV